MTNRTTQANFRSRKQMAYRALTIPCCGTHNTLWSTRRASAWFGGAHNKGVI